MRTFLILLLLANIGYLAWRQGWIGERPVPAVTAEQAPFEQAVQGLVLLTELPLEQRNLMSSLAQAQAARAESQQQRQQLEQEIETVAGQIGDVEDESTQEDARSIEGRELVVDSPVEAIALGAEVAAPVPEVQPWCASTGAFANQTAAASFVDSLAALGVEASIKTRQEPISSTWWVYIPPFPTEAEAREMLAELQARNIDSYFLRDGEMAGGISLGVFSRQESALIEQQRKADQGYEASIREVFRMGDRVYVDLLMPDAALREAPEWTAFLASAEGIELSEIACEMIASENEFP